MQASLTIPPEANLTSGDNPIFIGDLNRGESTTVNWTLVFTTIGRFNLDVNASGYRKDTDGYVEEHGSANVTVIDVAPIISILCPENATYSTSNVSLIFTVNEPTSWMGYSLDGQDNETITGNTTLPSLSDGPHYVTVYANDTAGLMGASDMIHFSVDTDPPNIIDVSQLPLEDSVQPGDTVNVNATVTDDVSGVKQVTMKYTNGSGTWIPVNMTNLDGNIWNGSIPAFKYCTYVNYTIMAEDKMGNVITSEEIFGYQHQYHVIPEFPLPIILPSVIAAILLAAILLAVVYRRKH